MSNLKPRWLDKHQKRLETLLCEDKPLKKIVELFKQEFDETFAYSTINARAIRTRKG
jgi:hypothetical protein